MILNLSESVSKKCTAKLKFVERKLTLEALEEAWNLHFSPKPFRFHFAKVKLNEQSTTSKKTIMPRPDLDLIW